MCMQGNSPVSSGAIKLKGFKEDRRIAAFRDLHTRTKLILQDVMYVCHGAKLSLIDSLVDYLQSPDSIM